MVSRYHYYTFPFLIQLSLYFFHAFINIVLPSQQEIENMHRQIFGDFDDEDGLDKVFTRLNNLRGNTECFIMYYLNKIPNNLE